MQSQSKKRRLILVCAAALCILGALLIIFMPKDNEEYTDNPSGETVSNPKDRQGESYNTDQQEIVYYGTRALSEAGLSAFALETFQQELRLYSHKNSDYIKSASVYVDDITRDRTGDSDVVSFPIKINDEQNVVIQINLVSLTKVQVTATKKDGAQLFQTGVIDKFQQEQDDSYTGDGAPPEDQ